MQSISLRRQVTIVAIVTEQFRQQATAELQQGLQQLDMEAQQLEFQGKRALSDFEKRGASAAELENIRAQLEEQRQRIKGQKADLLSKLDMVGKLENGSEFIQGTVDNFVEVKVGDHLYAKLANPQLIVKDGLVQEIRGEE
ncbi:MAG: YlqD family protein [Candidatus Sericytochromatia bacterium]|nr:YlqD family protein [Candidatus Sericytochromatia bacterium]